jgi:ABC-2 type transport system ATP-binding protein
MATDDAAVLVDGLRVTYGRTRALDDVSLTVAPGQTLGVLGHNGAGKTTLVRVLTTQVRPDAGRVLVDGIDVVADPARVRPRIGVTGQYAGLDDFLTAAENLELVGRLAGLRGAARKRARDLVDRFDLHEAAARRVGELSGGMRRRVDLAASLVAAPRVLFLDEPTTGLDPAARQTVWDVVRDLTAAGTTVILTTQYLEEADRLADQVMVLDHGRIAAQGTPAELKRLVGGKVLRATIPTPRLVALGQTPDASVQAGLGRTTVSFTLPDDTAAASLLAQLTDLTGDPGGLTDLEVTAPSLDDVFFHLASGGSAAATAPAGASA